METILALLQSYRAREARPPTVSSLSQVMKMESEDDHGSSGNSEDVVIKIIRVIANMSINGDVGQQDVAVFKRIQTYIDCSNVEAQIESSRVLGNLTRSRVVRDQLAGDSTWRAVVEL